MNDETPKGNIMPEETKCALGLNPIDMGRLFETVDTIKKNTDEIVKHLDEQNGRIHHLEQWRAYMLGGIAIIAIIIPIITKYVV
ncbi:MAG: hypothetical protein PHW53_04660 [Patescibacteria group bacterium]|nr:hypothetical protein [Patescibacteria group bacterium]